MFTFNIKLYDMQRNKKEWLIIRGRRQAIETMILSYFVFG